jgi:hypothetical protein
MTNYDLQQIWKYKNYKFATDFPVEIGNYLKKELSHETVIGHFKYNPFDNNLLLSQLNSVPKNNVT